MGFDHSVLIIQLSFIEGQNFRGLMPDRFEEFLPLGEKGKEFLFLNDARSMRIGKDELVRKLRVDQI